MCWKRSQPDPEPSPPTPLGLWSATESMQLNVTEVVDGSSVCPYNFKPCNSTAIPCYNGGIVCCNIENEHLNFCSCLTGWEEPDCLLESFEPAFGMSTTYDGNGKIAILAVLTVAVVAVIIIAAVFIIRKYRRQSRRPNDHSDPEQVPMNQTSVNSNLHSSTRDPERAVEKAPFLSRDSNGNEKGGS